MMRKYWICYYVLSALLVWETPQGAAQNWTIKSTASQDVSGNTYPSRNKYLSISFDLTTGMSNATTWKNPIGLSMSYIFSPLDRYKASRYYLGPYFSIAGKGYETSYSGSGMRNGKLEWSFSTLSLGLTQRYFFRSASQTKPFVDLDMGWRAVHNSVDTKYQQYSAWVGYLPGGDDIYENSESRFAVGFGAGCYFEVFGLRGFFIKLGVDTGNKIEVMNQDSTRETSNLNAAFFTFKIGVMI